MGEDRLINARDVLGQALQAGSHRKWLRLVVPKA